MRCSDDSQDQTKLNRELSLKSAPHLSVNCRTPTFSTARENWLLSCESPTSLPPSPPARQLARIKGLRSKIAALRASPETDGWWCEATAAFSPHRYHIVFEDWNRTTLEMFWIVVSSSSARSDAALPLRFHFSPSYAAAAKLNRTDFFVDTNDDWS